MHTLKNVHSWTSGLEVEFDAVNQIRNIASLPIVAGHVTVEHTLKQIMCIKG